MAVLNFSVCFLPDQCLLHLNPKHMADLPTYLPQAPAGDMCVLSSSVVSAFLWPHGLQPTRLLCPWNSSGKNTGVVAISSSRGSPKPRDRTGVS